MSVSQKALGELRIVVHSRSHLLHDLLPVEIRDAQHGLVQTIRYGESVKLPEGLYSIAAVLDTGRENVVHAHVTAGEARTVRFDSELQPRLAGAEEAAWGPIQFVEGSRGLEVQTGDHRLEISANRRAELPAWVVVTLRGRKLRTILPLSSGATENRRVTLRGSGTRVQVELADRRTVLRALQELMASGHVERTVALAKKAARLLRDKYRDPVGAAYGALLLKRFGELPRRAGWVDNLARDFPWLADGRILRASLLAGSRTKGARAEGLATLIEALRGPPPVFTEAFSLGVELLRRWPDDEGSVERERALRGLDQALATYDFAPTYSTFRSP